MKLELKNLKKVTDYILHTVEFIILLNVAICQVMLISLAFGYGKGNIGTFDLQGFALGAFVFEIALVLSLIAASIIKKKINKQT